MGTTEPDGSELTPEQHEANAAAEIAEAEGELAAAHETEAANEAAAQAAAQAAAAQQAAEEAAAEQAAQTAAAQEAAQQAASEAAAEQAAAEAAAATAAAGSSSDLPADTTEHLSEEDRVNNVRTGPAEGQSPVATAADKVIVGDSGMFEQQPLNPAGSQDQPVRTSAPPAKLQNGVPLPEDRAAGVKVGDGHTAPPAGPPSEPTTV